MTINEPWHDKTNKMSLHPAKTQIGLGIRPVWSESSLSAWKHLGPLTTRWAHSEDSDQTGQMPRLIWVFAGCLVTLLVLSCRGSNGVFLHLKQLSNHNYFQEFPFYYDKYWWIWSLTNSVFLGKQLNIKSLHQNKSYITKGVSGLGAVTSVLMI